MNRVYNNDIQSKSMESNVMNIQMGHHVSFDNLKISAGINKISGPSDAD